MDQKIKSHTTSRLLALALLAISLLAFGAILALDFAGCQTFFDPVVNSPAETYGRLITVVGILGFPFLGTLIIFYQPGNRIGWLALLFGVFDLLNTFAVHYHDCLTTGYLNLPGGELIPTFLVFTSLLLLITFGFFLMTFPDGHFLSRRWQQLSLIVLGVLTIYIIFALITRTFVISGVDELSAFVSPLFIFPMLGIVALFLRWRRSTGEMRQQIKWVAFFFATIGTMFFAVEVIGSFFYPAIFEGWFYLFDVVVFIVGLPIVFGLAIFKYRLFDIDIIIRRTLVYSVVTLALVLVYFGSVVLLQGVFTAVTNTSSPLAIVISTLLIAAIFQPLRRRVQDVIDRRFFRKKYDAQQVLAQFAETARDETDMDALQAELLHVVQETMQPTHISLWVKK
jgi:hypothetical protein